VFDNALWLIGLAPLAVGAVFVALGWMRGRMTRDWVTTEGMVVNRDGSADRGMPAYYPTFAWRDHHGVEHRRTSNVGASLQPSPGTRVRVRYDPEAPERAVMDTFSQSGKVFYLVGWIVIGLTVLIGGCALAIAAQFQ